MLKNPDVRGKRQSWKIALFDKYSPGDNVQTITWKKKKPNEGEIISSMKTGSKILLDTKKLKMANRAKK